MSAEMESIISSCHLLILPSSQWNVFHEGAKSEYLAIVHMVLGQDRVVPYKQVLVRAESDAVKATLYINDERVQVPSTLQPSPSVTGIADISTLLYYLDELNLSQLKTCANAYSFAHPKCSKYVFMYESREFCETCTAYEFEVPSMGPMEDAYDYLEAAPSCALMDAVQQPPALYPCGSCGEHFGSEELLEAHANTAHVGSKRDNQCAVCGKMFKSNSNVVDHMRTHLEVKPFKCDTCHKTFSKRYNLLVHIRVHSGERPYVCTKCGKTYSTMSNLSTHMMSFHSEEKRHSCEVCDKSFVHPRNLRIHMRKHTGEKPFSCDTCHKSFSKKIHLTIHIRTHTGERPHECEVCKRRFTTTGNLNKHRQRAHPGSPDASNVPLQ